MANKYIGNLTALLSLDDKKFQAGLKNSKSQVNAFGSAINSIGPMVAGAFSVAAIANYTNEAVKLAGKLEGVEEAFLRIAKPGLLDNLRESTRGTVADLKLMQNAVKASNFKIPMEDLAKLFEFATKRAAQTGESVDYLVDSIILGIGRKSPLILDNLGISAISLREKFGGLSAEAATVGDVARAVGEIATEEMEKMGEVSLTTAQKMEQLNVVQEELQTSWGKFIIKLANTTNYGEGINSLNLAVSSLSEGIDNVSFDNWQDFADLMTNIMFPVKGIKALWDVMRGGSDVQAKAISLTKAMTDAIAADKEEAEALAKSLEAKGIPATEAAKRANELMYQSLIKARGAEDLSQNQWDILTAQIEAFEQILYPATEAVEDDTEELEKNAKAAEDAAKAIRKLNAESMKRITGGMKPVTTEELSEGNVLTDQQQAILEAMGAVGGSRITGMQLPTEPLKEFDIALRNTFDGMSAFTSNYSTWVEETVELNEMMADSFKNLAMGMADAMSNAVATWVQGGDGLTALFQGMLGAVANFLKGLGQAMMASGMAGIALKALSSNPALAIAAGLALQLAAGAVEGFMSKGVKMAEGGIVPAGYPNDSYPAFLTSGERVVPPHKLDSAGGVVVLETRIKGEDLYIIQNKMASKHQRYGGN